MAGSRAWEGRVKMKLEHLLVPEGKEMLKEWRGTQKQFEGAPTGQSRITSHQNNFSIDPNMANQIWKHGLTLIKINKCLIKNGIFIPFEVTLQNKII